VRPCAFGSMVLNPEHIQPVAQEAVETAA
jgi:hypothetical protein